MAFTDYDKCSLLLPMDGANNGTVFTDWSPNNTVIARVGDVLPVTSTAQSKYYGSSAYFPADTNAQKSAMLATPAINIPISTPFTVAMWYRTSTIGSSTGNVMFDIRGTTPTYEGVVPSDTNFVLSYRTSSLRFALTYGAAGSVVETTTAPIVNTWHHLAITRDASNIIRLFFDGALEATSGTISNAFNGPYPVIGAVPALSVVQPARYIQDFVFVNGAALWTSNFTPPTRLIGEVSGNVKDKDDVAASRIVTACPRTNPTRAFSTLSSAVDGSYALRVPSTEVSRIALADETTLYNDIVDRIIPE